MKTEEEKIESRRISQGKYAASDKGRIREAKYRLSEKGKEAHTKAIMKHAQTEKYKLTQKNYKQSKEGRKVQAKTNARRRGLESVFLFDNPFDKSIPVVGHHISDTFEVYLPRSLHLSHLHGKYRQLHMDELKPYVESIYNISYLVEDLIVCQDVNNKKKGV